MAQSKVAECTKELASVDGLDITRGLGATPTSRSPKDAEAGLRTHRLPGPRRRIAVCTPYPHDALIRC